jgi:hypothetical protein
MILVGRLLQPAPRAVGRVAIRIAALPDLTDAQTAVRQMCRSLTLDGTAVLDAVIAVTELANHHFIGPQRSGRVGLEIVRSKGGIALEISAEDDSPALDGPQPLCSRSRLTFPRALPRRPRMDPPVSTSLGRSGRVPAKSLA